MIEIENDSTGIHLNTITITITAIQSRPRVKLRILTPELSRQRIHLNHAGNVSVHLASDEKPIELDGSDDGYTIKERAQSHRGECA